MHMYDNDGEKLNERAYFSRSAVSRVQFENAEAGFQNQTARLNTLRGGTLRGHHSVGLSHSSPHFLSNEVGALRISAFCQCETETKFEEIG